ncbi:MAG: mechanosensitive ion channel [Candidatus Hydrogenedentes bacterium]|nr:mechanosensitive ion channel [Candidatus Hydrogenedentota bacterium]
MSDTTISSLTEMFLPPLISVGYKALAALALFGAFWLGAIFARSVGQRLADRDRRHKDILHLLVRAAYVGILAFGAAMALGTAGVDIWPLIAGLGVGGFALGFAMKDLASSIIAGLMILFLHPFKVGDRVFIAGFEGSVLEIDLRYVTLDMGGNRVLVPSSTLLNSPITVLGGGSKGSSPTVAPPEMPVTPTSFAEET